MNQLPDAFCNDQCLVLTLCGKLWNKHRRGINPRRKWKRPQLKFSRGSRACKWFLYMTLNDIHIFPSTYFLFFYVLHGLNVEPSKNTYSSCPSPGKLTECSTSPDTRRPIFLVFEPPSSHGRSRGVPPGGWGIVLGPPSGAVMPSREIPEKSHGQLM